MKTIAGLLVGVSVFLGMDATRGETVTVDFESIDVATELQVIPGAVVQGMRFVEDPTVGAVHFVNDGMCEAARCAASGSKSLLYEGLHLQGQPGLFVTQASGLPFRLLSLDVGEAFATPHVQNAEAIELRGGVAGGDVIETIIPLDGYANSKGADPDFEAVTLPAEFSGATLDWLRLKGVYVTGGSRAGFSIDNIVFDVDGQHVAYTSPDVPEPATWVLALWMFSSIILQWGQQPHRRQKP